MESQCSLFMLLLVAVVSPVFASSSSATVHDSPSVNSIVTSPRPSKSVNTTWLLWTGAGHHVVHYTNATLNTSYLSSAEFDPRGMEYLYLATNTFLDLVQPDQPDPSSSETAVRRPALDTRQLAAARRAGNLTDTLVHLALFEWPRLVRHHPGLAALGALGIVTAALLPLLGLLVCCCRCAGRCGGDRGTRMDEYDKRFDRCRRICLGVTLALFVIVLLFALVASFFVNEQLEKGVRGAPQRMHTSVNDVKLFAVNTERQVTHLLVNNYDQLSAELNAALDGCGERVRRRLANVSRAVAVQELTNIAAGLHHVLSDLNDIVNVTRLLQERASQLEVGLRDVQRELTELLPLCDTLVCRQLVRQYNVSRLVLLGHFELIPDVRGTAQRVSQLVDGGVEREVEAGQRAFERISRDIQERVTDVLPQVRQAVDEAGTRLRKVADQFSSVLADVDVDEAHDYIDQADDFLRHYGHVAYYAFVIVSGLLVVIVFCLVVGLFCGLCGRRAGNVFGEDDTCNKGTGANFLLSAVFFFFLYGWLLLLLTTGLFLVGGLTQYYVCDGLTRPHSPDAGLNLFQSVVNVDPLLDDLKLSNVSLAQLVSRCHHNESIYGMLDLQQIYPLPLDRQQLRTELALDERLDTLRRHINANTDVQILTPAAREQLDRLAISGIGDIDYTTMTDSVAGSLTALDLRAMAQALRAAADSLANTRSSPTASRLRNQATILEAQQRVLDQMSVLVTALANSSADLQQHVLFNQSSVSDAVVELVRQADSAQTYLRTRGADQLSSLAEEYVQRIMGMLDRYVDRVNTSVNGEIGRCGPLSQVYNATVVTLCDRVVAPLNGFWASVGLCLLLLVPCVVLSLSVTPLYRKTLPFSGSLLEDDDGLNDEGCDSRRQHMRPASSNGRSRGGAASTGSGGGRHRSRSSNQRRRRGSDGLTDGVLIDSGRGLGYRSESPPYVAIPPRRSGHQVSLNPLGGGGAGDTEPKAPPMWEMYGGPPGYNDVATDFDRPPPPYFFPGPAQQ